MAELKRTTINIIIGGLLTAIGYVVDIVGLLFGGEPSTQTVGYVAPVVQSGALTVAKSWFLPVLGYSIVALLFAVGFAFAWQLATATKDGKRKPKEDDGQRRMNQIISATNRATTVAAALPEPQKIHWLTLIDAVEKSKPRAWIIGQATEHQPNQEHARQAVGNLLAVDYQTTQFAILGGSGGGKTSSTGMLMLIHAITTGLHPIVLDAKDGLDWGPLGDSGIVEWYRMDENNLGGYLDQLIAIYHQRHAIMRKLGKSKIYDLPSSHYVQPLFVILEEFGSTWEASGNDAEIEKKFNFLSRMGRAAGIILCPIDQTPSAWSKAMRGNAKFAVCYNTNGKALGAFDEYHVHELPLVGVFSRGNVFYKAWHTLKQWNMMGMGKIQRRYLVETAKTVNVPVVSDPQPLDDGRNARLQVVETPINALNVPVSKNDDTLVIPPSLERAFQRFRKWDEFCEKFFVVHPEASQAQLRKVMSKLDGREPDTFKTEAFKWYHAYSPLGDKVKAKEYMKIAS